MQFEETSRVIEKTAEGVLIETLGPNPRRILLPPHPKTRFHKFGLQEAKDMALTLGHLSPVALALDALHELADARHCDIVSVDFWRCNGAVWFNQDSISAKPREKKGKPQGNKTN